MKLFIFGSTGDLVRRKVLPALSELKEDVEIIAIGRKDHSNEQYSEIMSIPNFKKKIRYVRADFDETHPSKEILSNLDKNQTNFFYVSLPPNMLNRILEYIGEIKKRGYEIKLLVEKPFGTSLSDAEGLKKIIDECSLDVLISDHYLFKKNVLSLKKVNFSKIKMVSLEYLGLEKRAEYYDSTGALKDMVQNHFLNIIFKLFDDFKKFKIIKYERKQYEGYETELGKKSDTETFVHLIIESNGKIFEFITGKAFDSKKSYIEIDGERIELDSSENPYVEIFERFLNSETKDFPTIEQTFNAWKIIDSIPKTKLGYYKKGITFNYRDN